MGQYTIKKKKKQGDKITLKYKNLELEQVKYLYAMIYDEWQKTTHLF